MTFDFSAAYEALNADDSDYRFYAATAERLGVNFAADLGCGTGVLAVLIASQGADVIGVDPDPEMLAVARARPGGHQVQWVEGSAPDLPSNWADLITMTGHVSQVFTTETEWASTLQETARALAVDGVLAFEMRNPLLAHGERWTREQTLRIVQTEDGPVEFWHETREVSLPLVSYATITCNLRTGEETTHLDTLAFRDLDDLEAGLSGADLAVDTVMGSWHGDELTPASEEIIILARQLSAPGARQRPARP